MYKGKDNLLPSSIPTIPETASVSLIVYYCLHSFPCSDLIGIFLFVVFYKNRVMLYMLLCTLFSASFQVGGKINSPYQLPNIPQYNYTVGYSLFFPFGQVSKWYLVFCHFYNTIVEILEILYMLMLMLLFICNSFPKMELLVQQKRIILTLK